MQSAHNKSFKHHFLPHPKHKKRATLLNSHLVFLYSLILLIIFSFLKTTPNIKPGILGYASNINVNDLLKYTNNKRKAAGVAELKLNDKLSKAAQEKAKHMFKNNYWAHVAPDGTDPWTFIINADYDYIFAGENLAKNFNNSKDVVEAWFKSPSHKENLINPKYTDVGFAVVNGVLDGYETTLVVQMFGKPKAASTQIASAQDQRANQNLNQQYTNNQPQKQEPKEEEPAQPLPTYTQGDFETNLANKEEIKPAFNQEQIALKPKINIYKTNRFLVLSFSMFMLSLFSLDIWYSKKHSIAKLTAHTFAHMIFVIFAVTAVFLAIKPGRLI